ncbi:MAG: hypothetical protein CVV62_00930, partial [Tenericutes bacterium HGW-Tenericutes-7]
SIIFVGCNAKIDDINFYLNPGVDTITLNSEYEDPGVTAKVFGLKRSTEVLENTVNTNEIGTYYITYSFEYKEFYFELTRIVVVIDETPPVIELNPGIDTIKVGQTWIDAGVSVDDNSENNTTVAVSGNVDIATKGSYIITYTVTDSSGNSSSIRRIINVI